MTMNRVRQSLRTLRRHKRFTTMAVLCLGMAIALNTTMYSVLDALISPHSDVREPERLAQVAYFGDYKNLIPADEKERALLGASFHEGMLKRYFNLSEDFIVERGARIREVEARTVSANYFTLLGLRPKWGRLLDERDTIGTSAPEAVVLGERLWKQLFPEKESFEPSTILVGGKGRHVVGVLPRGSGFAAVDLWQLPNAQQSKNSIYRERMVRLKPGVTVEQAAAELAAISQRFRAITGEGKDAGWLFRPSTGRGAYGVWNFRYALIGSVLAVLLIACANLANLQLARGVARARELATRAAVGATRSDIIGQLVLESGWLALGGLIVGGILTAWGIWLVDHYIPREVAEYMSYPQVSWRVLAAGIAVTLFCLGVVGLLPALRLSRVDINELLKSGAGTGRSQSMRRQYGALVIVEVSLALALLSATGLMTRSALRVHAFDYREDYRGIVMGGAFVKIDSLDGRSRATWSEILVQQTLRTDSVALAATTTNASPRKHAVSAYDPAGQLFSQFAPMWSYSIVSADYFRVMRMPMLKGRDFAPGEFAGRLAVLDSTAAKSLWPGQDPIGKQLKLDSANVNAPWFTVIGVVGEYRRDFSSSGEQVVYLNGSRLDPSAARFRGAVYVLNSIDTVTVGRMSRRNMNKFGTFIGLVIRTHGDSKRLPLEVRNKLLELPGVTPSYPRPWEEASGISRLRAKHDFMTTLFLVFSAFALALAALGVYAIIAFMVAQRTREFGVRIAVGAGERDIRQMVLREGNILALTGIAVGLLVTYKTAGWVRAFVFSEYDRYDSRVFGVVALVLFAAAWLASYLPARRAMRINPVEALRND